MTVSADASHSVRKTPREALVITMSHGVFVFLPLSFVNVLVMNGQTQPFQQSQGGTTHFAVQREPMEYLCAGMFVLGPLFIVDGKSFCQTAAHRTKFVLESPFVVKSAATVSCTRNEQNEVCLHFLFLSPTRLMQTIFISGTI